jgi:hypothetical protein
MKHRGNTFTNAIGTASVDQIVENCIDINISVVGRKVSRCVNN